MRLRQVALVAAELEPVVSAYTSYRSLSDELEGAREVLGETDDPEIKELAERHARETETTTPSGSTASV